MKFDLSKHPQRRMNILTGEWILVSPHRFKRPWQGKEELPNEETLPLYDRDCYLCPGNTRSGGKMNPQYHGTYVFDNDYSALSADSPAEKINENNLIIARGEPGICRVVCFSPRHDLTLPQMSVPAIREVIDTWTAQFSELKDRKKINYVQIFENKGEMMGCSNFHPHCQIWAQESIPVEPAKELKSLGDYYQTKNSCLLCDYLNLEKKVAVRIVLENEYFLVLVPFWAIWPFETLVVSKRHLSNLVELNFDEQNALADIIKRLTIKYDNIFRTSFPYSAGFHQAPTDGEPYPEWHLHMHFYPPLLRSAAIKKFMVGYEMLANPQRDFTAEWAAEKLRNLPGVHYRQM